MATKETIKSNFENGRYQVKAIPWILEAENDGVSVRRDGLVQDAVQALEGYCDDDENGVLSKKLKCKGCGEFSLRIALIEADCFQSRARFEDLHARRWWIPRQGEQTPPQPLEVVQRISLAEALMKFNVEISCNLDFYLKNQEELNRDLGVEKMEYNINDRNSMRDLEIQLMQKQMGVIFGVEELPERIEFVDFRLLFDDGNDAFGSAERDGKYYTFYSCVD